ncbi:hypothetical protein J7T55_005026 [Diaporthe amygdali]|uniref:uncharacterized protein n=1 Tax=Phomopsis amygdali TaxID=1214568 RepID=UPI0022FE05F8|nr:uncharacterized protein J7T55_005026 [Diaporthe amygdali]KAJ0116080.1 hypothetical protein J7T55_005026 [Diaporthe amygdali]
MSRHGKVKNFMTVPALIGVIDDEENVLLFGGKQLKAGSEYFFPDNLKTQLFVNQTGPDHAPHVGVLISIDHGELDSPYTGTHFDAQANNQATTAYRLCLSVLVKEAKLIPAKLSDSTDGGDFKKLATIPSEYLPQSVADVQNKGMSSVPCALLALFSADTSKQGGDLMAIVIQLNEAKMGCATYPPFVAKGPNYGLVHSDEPFDGVVSLSKILSARFIIAYFPSPRLPDLTNAIKQSLEAAPIDAERPFGVRSMHMYDREHLEQVADELYLKVDQQPIRPRAVTDWTHYRAANVLGMGAETLPLQQDIEELAKKKCQSQLFRADDGRLIAALELPKNEDFRKLMAVVNKSGQKVDVHRLEPLPWGPKSGERKPEFEEREPYPATILENPPAGIDLPSNCDIVAQMYPRKVDDETIGAADELSDPQTKRFIASFSQHLDEVPYNQDKISNLSKYFEWASQEISKAKTRNMLCGRGTREYRFDLERQAVCEIPPPYQRPMVNLLLEGSKRSAGAGLTTKIIASTIGKLGAYSELVGSAIKALPDGVLCIEAFPGAGKTTVTAAIDALLCLLYQDYKITVIAGQHAALDALNLNVTRQLVSSVVDINKENDMNTSEPAVHLPLVLRTTTDQHAEISEMVRIIKGQYRSSPDPTRPNTLCELVLQLLGAGPHRLPDFSKAELIELANAIKSADDEAFQKLRSFVAGELTWDDANKDPRKEGNMDQNTVEVMFPTGQCSNFTVSLEPKGKTAKAAIKAIIPNILPHVNILIGTTATIGTKMYETFVRQADLCQNEEAGATSCPQIFTGYRGLSQRFIVSGDNSQFGPFMLDYRKHIFSEYMTTSTLDMVKRAGYPVFQLNVQYRAIDGQFDPVYEIFYTKSKKVESPDSQRPENHPEAQRVEESFVADFAALQPSPEGHIIPMFINVPDSTCDFVGKSRFSPKQTKAALYIVQKLISCEVKPADIMVIGAYRAEILELRKSIPDHVMVTTADAVQGQERPYVVFVFATNKETGPGFTKDPQRLCVSMTRQKSFLALVGDIGAVDYQIPSRALADKDHIHLASIHKYFVTKKRVGHYGPQQEAVQDAGTSDDEEERRLLTARDEAVAARDEALAVYEKAVGDSARAVAALEAYLAGKSKKPALNSTINTGLELDKHSLHGSGKTTTSGTGKTQVECYNCHEKGHMSKDCNNEKSMQCFNCQEFGHMSTNPEKPRDYSKVKCSRCNKFGHTKVKCDQPEPQEGTNSGFDNDVAGSGFDNDVARPAIGMPQAVGLTMVPSLIGDLQCITDQNMEARRGRSATCFTARYINHLSFDHGSRKLVAF